MKMKYSLLFVAFLMLLTPLKASAVFDGERHGFMMNIGGGFGQGRFSWQGNSVDGTGFIADIKIGGGPSDQVHIYYVNQALWYSPGSSSSRVINAFYGGGVSYYLEPQAPSLFFSGALGLGMLINADWDGSDSGGFGFTLGAGYEIVRNLAVEFTFMNSSVSSDFSSENNTISHFAITFSWLAY